jgi:hypothetical protein
MSTQTTFTPEQVRPLLDPLVVKISDREKRLAAELAADREDKNAANVLCRMAGLKELYDIEAPLGTSSEKAAPASLRFKIDEFVGMELSEAVRAYLEARKATGTLEGPATIDEIYDGLLAGGYKFGGATENPANHKRAMNIALTRNTAQMHKINDTTFGLRRWYGMRAPRKSSSATTTTATTSSASTPENLDDDDPDPSGDPSKLV